MQYQQLSRTLPTFDVLAQLARQDPRALENLRQRLTNDVIRTARNPQSQQRLRGLQFTIDLERRRARDPLAACMRLSEMMHSSLADLHEVLAGVEQNLAPGAGTPTDPAAPYPAIVIPFKPSTPDV